MCVSNVSHTAGHTHLGARDELLFRDNADDGFRGRGQAHDRGPEAGRLRDHHRDRRQGHVEKKIGVDFRNYRILGACNPKLAHEALEIEDKVGTMLPCNVVVQEIGGGRVEVAAIDPVASMQAIDNPRLREAAAVVQSKLKSVIENL